MFEHIKISDIKGLKECDLLNLGKINVICGKNNSGKSTLLEGIEQHGTHGKHFEENDIDKFFEETLSEMRITLGTQPASIYSSALKDVIKVKQVWYASDNDKIQFVNMLQEALRVRMPHMTYNNQAVINAYDRMTLRQERVVLIPPKRQLELSVQIDASQEAISRGSGILNYLFYAKNQVASSDDYSVYSQVMEAFLTISPNYTFDILMGKKNLLTLRFSYQNQPWIEAQHCGLGLQDLLVLLYFSIHPQYSVVLIEEPESHLHPDIQRRFLYFLKEKTDKQFFLTTHSNIFLNNSLVDKVFFTRFENAVEVDDATSKAMMLNDLGYAVTDNLVSDLIILVEGPTDRPIIEEFLIKFGLFGLYDIKIWPLGGDIMDQVDLSVFAQKYTIIALIDNDPKSHIIRERFCKKCKTYNIPVKRLKRYAIENYFSIRVLREVFKGQISPDLTEIDFHKKLEDQIGIDVKGNNRKLASKMNLEELEGSDLYEFFEEVKRLCVQASKKEVAELS